MHNSQGHRRSFNNLPLLLALGALAVAATGCSKSDAAQEPEKEPKSAVKGCGDDYADPMKEFCVKVPKGYEPKPQKKQAADSLYTELVDFNGPASGFTISVGFSSTNFKSFDEQLKADTKYYADSKDNKIDETGKTAGGGKWWVYTPKGYDKTIAAMAKSNDDKVIHCSPNNLSVKPEVIEACKTIRAYPK